MSPNHAVPSLLKLGPKRTKSPQFAGLLNPFGTRDDMISRLQRPSRPTFSSGHFRGSEWCSRHTAYGRSKVPTAEIVWTAFAFPVICRLLAWSRALQVDRRDRTGSKLLWNAFAQANQSDPHLSPYWEFARLPTAPPTNVVVLARRSTALLLSAFHSLAISGNSVPGTCERFL